jgi:hypothetical protein
MLQGKRGCSGSLRRWERLVEGAGWPRMAVGSRSHVWRQLNTGCWARREHDLAIMR